jgi:hypothetical protein
MVHSHYHVITNTELIDGFYSKIPGLPINVIKQALMTINEVVITDGKEFDDGKAKNEQKIDQVMRLLNPDDYQEMVSIGIDAHIYVTDANHEKESLKRDTLIELYMRKIALPDSEFSHCLIRDAANNGVMWLVKFLVEQGVVTKDIPCYDNGNRKSLEQLYQILGLDHDQWFGPGIKENRKNVRDYLVQHNLM